MQQIAQLFIVLLMGYVVVKAGLLKASDSKVLSVVFVYLVMPCVVLNAFQIDDTPQIRTGLLYSMGIAVGMHVVFLVLNATFKKPLRLDVVEQVNIIYSNAAALVIPLVQALLGEEYVVYSCAFVIVQLILLWTHASACLQEGAKLEWKKILANVNLIAIVAGALLYLLHISLPSPIVSTLSSVGAMIGPMGMLTKARMYRSITGYGRNAIAVKTAYVGESKICRYEIPYGVTGTIKHTGLKGRAKGIMHR